MDGALIRNTQFVRCGALVAFVGLAISACSDSGEFNPTNPAYVGEIRVTGIEVTTGANPYEVCAWGTPTSGPNPECAPRLYPNPCFSICYDLPCSGIAGEVSLPDHAPAYLSFLPALGPGESAETPSWSAGAVVVHPDPKPIRVIPLEFADSTCTSRCFAWFRWDFTDADGRMVPAGFYRAFVSQGKRLGWTDLYFAGPIPIPFEESPVVALYLTIQSCLGW